MPTDGITCTWEAALHAHRRHYMPTDVFTCTWERALHAHRRHYMPTGGITPHGRGHYMPTDGIIWTRERALHAHRRHYMDMGDGITCPQTALHAHRRHYMPTHLRTGTSLWNVISTCYLDDVFTVCPVADVMIWYSNIHIDVQYIFVIFVILKIIFQHKWCPF